MERLCASRWRVRHIGLLIPIAAGLYVWPVALGGEQPAVTAPAPPAEKTLSPAQWEQMERSVDRALAFLARQQRSDGSFPAMESGQPAVTALCALAFMSRGHAPGEGRYGEVVNKAVDFVLSCQHPDGLIALRHPTMPWASKNPTHTASYNHAISGLLLSEAYGMTPDRAGRRIRTAIESALVFTEKRIPDPKQHPDDRGGWRYGKSKGPGYDDSDLSITSWQLMFLRSSRNAGFDVPARYIDEALAYVGRCFDAREGTFLYTLRSERKISRGMAGAGILAMSLGGRHRTDPARRAGDWLLRKPFDQYGITVGPGDRFFYGAFYCSQAMFQLGGRHWTGFYPTLLRTLATGQHADGSWDPEYGGDGPFGTAYSTAMAVLALTPPYQLLPIFQR